MKTMYERLSNWRPVDFFVIAYTILAAVALLVSWLTLPSMQVSRMEAFVGDGERAGQVMIWAEIDPTTTINGGFRVTINDAQEGDDTICKSPEVGHTYYENRSYDEPKTLDWWTHGHCATARLPRCHAITIKTEYRVPGLLWGLFPPRWEPATTNPVKTPGC